MNATTQIALALIEDHHSQPSVKMALFEVGVALAARMRQRPRPLN